MWVELVSHCCDDSALRISTHEDDVDDDDDGEDEDDGEDDLDE